MTSSTGLPTDLLAPRGAALVVWDMQVGMAGKAVGIEAIKAAVLDLVDSADSADVPVIWSRHVGMPLRFTPESRRFQLMQRQKADSLDKVHPHMLPGDPEVEFLPGVAPKPGHLVLDKTTPSFFVGTPFEQALHAVNARTIVLCGVATERGIEMTGRHAMTLGYHVVIANGAIGSFTTEGHEIGMAFIRTAMMVLPASDIEKAWRAA